MARFFRAGVFRAGVAGMVALVTVPFTLGIAQPAGAASAGANQGCATRGTADCPIQIDHLLCYTTDQGNYTIPVGVTLKNQFNTSGFKPTITPRPAFHCNPVQKTVPGHVYKIGNPNAHQLCFPITAPTQATPKVIVANQFGQATLTTGQPTDLCLPSWKSETGPPTETPPEPPGMDHMTCYPVQYTTGGGTFTPPAFIFEKDQFGSTQIHVFNPDRLCVPTTKTVGRLVYPARKPTQHLLCFMVSQTPIKPQVWDKNQFGTQKMLIRQTVLLCLPSTKSIVTTITDHGRPEPSHIGQAVKFTAVVNPNPDGGTVGWTDGGTAIPGCTAQPVKRGTGQATCQVTFNTLGTHPIIATYSGDPTYAGSQSTTLNHMVT